MSNETCDCGRLDCDQCLQEYLARVREVASNTGEQVLSGLKGLAKAFVTGLQEGGFNLSDWDGPEDAVHGGEVAPEGHVYLSTSCFHSLHDRCQAGVVQLGLKTPGDNGLAGLKVPASCKFCAAPCVCDCHDVDARVRADVARHRAMTTTPKAVKERWCCNGNAEECVLCDVGELPYPWICPGGHKDTPANRRRVLVDATDRGKEALKATMKRLRVHDAARRVAEANPRLGDAGVEICEEPHETIEEEEACERLREAAQRARKVIVHPDQDELDPQALRAHVSRRLVQLAEERCVAEWICCDPVDPTHLLCVQGNAARRMLTGLLTDDEEVWPPTSELLDEVMRLVQGVGEYRVRRSVLAESELRELYGKAIQRAVSDGMRWNEEHERPALPLEVATAVTEAVLTVRDRELARNRQRLALADDQLARHLQDENLQQAFDEARETRVRLEERLKTLDEVQALLHRECASPFEQLAFNNPLVWLRGERKRVERELDNRPKG